MSREKWLEENPPLDGGKSLLSLEDARVVLDQRQQVLVGLNELYEWHDKSLLDKIRTFPPISKNPFEEHT